MNLANLSVCLYNIHLLLFSHLCPHCRWADLRLSKFKTIFIFFRTSACMYHMFLCLTEFTMGETVSKCRRLKKHSVKINLYSYSIYLVHVNIFSVRSFVLSEPTRFLSITTYKYNNLVVFKNGIHVNVSKALHSIHSTLVLYRCLFMSSNYCVAKTFKMQS